MMIGEVQWDAQLGGTEALPQSIHLLGHAAARSAELAQMHAHLSAASATSATRSSHSVKLAFQRIPHYMRRRAMSHNVRRLPRRLRDIHAAQMRKSRNGRTDTDLQAQMRRPSRKYRRRPANLISEYTRRRTNLHWLHTHIWHAKRFHMELRWGWRLPIRPTARAYRSNYRAAAKHCFVQDISFVSCIQLDGNQEDIVAGLAKMSDTGDKCCIGTTNLTATSVIRGNREGTIHTRNALTKQPIGHVTYQWRPQVASGNQRAIWLWVHPAYYCEIMSNLYRVFFSGGNAAETTLNDDDYIPVDNQSITITNLRHELARFTVRGPLATCVLQQALRTTRHQDIWWEEIRTLTAQCVSPRSVFELLVKDPRLNYPQKRTKATVTVLMADETIRLAAVKVEKMDVDNAENRVETALLWDASIRHQVTSNRESNSTLARSRTKLLVPGSIPSGYSQQIPMILIQDPGETNSGFASGWDVILPTSYAQATWLALILWGGRAGGLRDSTHIHLLEAQSPAHHSLIHPDTAAGRTEHDRRTIELERKYWAKPPNRRCNYAKLGVVSPFKARWQTLMRDWWLQGGCRNSADKVQVEVLRDGRVLRIIADALESPHKSEISQKPRLPHKLCKQIKPTEISNCPSIQLPSILNYNQPALIHVRLALTGRGRCNPNALICLPQLQDWNNSRNIEEPFHSDRTNQQARKKLRSEHLAQLKRGKRTRKAAKLDKNRETSDKMQFDDSSEYTSNRCSMTLEEYRHAIRHLWVPNNATTVRNSCAREVIGWVTEAAFSFVCGRWIALGYVVLPALSHLLSCQMSLSRQQHQHQHDRKQVLVRDTQSRCYRFAAIQVLHIKNALP